MKFGYFDDKKREYVITTPETPYPWINYLGKNDFFSIISNTAGGYAFYKDARLRRLTRYRYNNVPLDSNGRYFYITDGNTTWNPSWQPCRTALDFYECHHGFGYTRFLTAKNRLKADLLFFVPDEADVEIQMLTLKNDSDEKKEVSLVSFIEWCLYNAQDDGANFQRNFSTGEVEIEKSSIINRTEYRERRNHFAFYSVNSPVNGFDTDRDRFLGMYNGLDNPLSIRENKSFNSVADGWSPCASHRISFTLNKGEEKTFIFLLGYVENTKEEKFDSSPSKDLIRTNNAGLPVNKKKMYEIQSLFDTREKVLSSFERLKKSWDEILSNFTLKTGDEKLDRMALWNQYQCVVTYNFARSASYFESGIGRGIGFRDTSQDMLGVVHSLPHKRIRERLFDVASTQFEDGSAYHQFQPLTKRGNGDIGSNFNDDPLWLVLGVSQYIKESGDTDFLSLEVPFDNSPVNRATMFEHLKRSYRYAAEHKGPHNLPLIGRADWNDCLNLNCFSDNPNDSFQTCTNREGKNAESVMIAEMFIYVTADYVSLCRLMNDEKEAEFALEQSKIMEEAVCKYGWDGEWFLRAYDDAGKKVGSSECENGKIYIETQGFGSMAQIGKDKNLPEKALDSVEKYLDTKYGIVILFPAYRNYHIELGEVSSYPPGYKENGGIFCHNNPWVIIGEAVNGRYQKAFEHYKKIAPSYVEEFSEVHKTEPYVYSQMIAGKEAGNFGQAKNSWLTGTAAWNMVALSRYIAGVRPEFSGLYIEPRLPSHIKKAEITRRFRGVQYIITVENNRADGKVSLFTDENADVNGLTVKAKDNVKTVRVRAVVE